MTKSHLLRLVLAVAFLGAAIATFTADGQCTATPEPSAAARELAAGREMVLGGRFCGGGGDWIGTEPPYGPCKGKPRDC